LSRREEKKKRRGGPTGTRPSRPFAPFRRTGRRRKEGEGGKNRKEAVQKREGKGERDTARTFRPGLRKREGKKGEHSGKQKKGTEKR